MTASEGTTPAQSTPEQTTPEQWRVALATHRLRTLDADFGRLVVVSAHPDDETLAVSGVMQAAHRGGSQVELVVATDGEAAFPDLDASGRAALASTRRRELHAALHAQGLSDVTVHWLGLPDSSVDAEAVAERLGPLLEHADTYLAPWTGDPHPDHAAAGIGTATAAPTTTHGWAYPIWMWPWLHPADPTIPWSRAFTHTLDGPSSAAKQRAIECFVSQLRPGVAGEEPILTPSTVRHFGTGTELVFRSPPAGGAPVERFTELYRDGNGDPWRTHDSWYEQRKRDVLLACLPRADYRHAAEPGCGTGELTRALAVRCTRLDASDFAEPAVERARAATEGLGGVQVSLLALPSALPDGLDLAVLSEVLYYLGDADLTATLERLATAVGAGGDLVVAHWRGWPADAPRDADEVHRRLIEDARWRVLVEHVDSEFVLHVLRRR